MYEYGAMVIIYKEREEMIPDLFLSFPFQWKLGVQPSWSNAKMFPVNSSKHSYFHVGKIKDEASLEKVALRI